MANLFPNKKVQALDTDIYRWCNAKIVKCFEDGMFEVSFDGWSSKYNRVLETDLIREPIDDASILRRRFVRNDENCTTRSDAQRLIRGDIVTHEMDGKIVKGEVYINDPFLDTITLANKKEISYTTLRNRSFQKIDSVQFESAEEKRGEYETNITSDAENIQPTEQNNHQRSASKTKRKRKLDTKTSTPKVRKTKAKQTPGITVLGHATTNPYVPSSPSSESDTSSLCNITVPPVFDSDITQACSTFKEPGDLTKVIEALGLEQFPPASETPQISPTDSTSNVKSVAGVASGQVLDTFQNGIDVSESNILNCFSSAEVKDLKRGIDELKTDVAELRKEVSSLKSIDNKLDCLDRSIKSLTEAILVNRGENNLPCNEQRRDYGFRVTPSNEIIEKIQVNNKLFWQIRVVDFPSQVTEGSIEIAIKNVLNQQVCGVYTQNGHYQIHKMLIRDAEVEESSEISKYARSLTKRIFTLGEIFNRNVKGRAKMKGGSEKKPLDFGKIEAVKEEAFRFFPTNSPLEKTKSWQMCINEMNRHILYCNRKMTDTIDLKEIIQFLPGEKQHCDE